MPLAGEPEMRPESRGRRVFTDDLKVGDRIDVWSKRSASYMVRENMTVLKAAADNNGYAACNEGLNLRDAKWGEVRVLD